MQSAGASTQEHLPIAGIQDGIVIMNDASVRAIVRVQPINFELKSEQEQNAIIYSYQSFLNSLDFPIELVVNSRRLDLERYLLKLEEQKKTTSSDLLRLQIDGYVDFVRRLITIANIMAKRFYVVVSYAALAGGKTSTPSFSLGSLFGKGSGAPATATLYQDQFERYKAELSNRISTVATGLGRVGLQVEQVDTQGIIELLYSAYNPDIAAEERLTDISQINSGVISSNQPPLPQAEQTTTQPTQPPQ
jgi:type IV secretory pathway VirB4 component